ncbi:MAG: lyase family protein, partial [Armatimonadota bacterium]
CRAGYLTKEETDQICRGLEAVGRAFAKGSWTISAEEEDAHTAIENRLTEKIGDLGGKVHLGRSRNDQVLVAVRLYLAEQCYLARARNWKVRGALATLADRYRNVPLPGYTHMQRAMPSSVSLWAEAFAAELAYSETLIDAAEKLAKLCPLGSAAGYGTPGLELDRSFTAKALGMTVQEPVTASQLSRGKAESTLAFALTTLLNDLGRLATELCLYNSSEFGFVRLPDEMTTGSSVMPQKRNPDVFELVRAHSAQASSDLTAILSLTTKMTSGYHRDLQLIKPPLFRLVDRFEACFRVMARALEGVEFKVETTTAAVTPELFAAEQAFELVKTEGISFREAYRRVAKSLS